MMTTTAGSVAAPKAATLVMASAFPVGQALSPRMLVGVLVAALVAFGAVAAYQRIRVARSGIAGVDRMDLKTFEAFLASLFRDLGYEIEGSRTHGDFAAELVVVKDGHRSVVEGKRWSKHLGVTAVQAARTAMTDFACDGAIVVANRQFTHQAGSSPRHPASSFGTARRSSASCWACTASQVNCRATTSPSRSLRRRPRRPPSPCRRSCPPVCPPVCRRWRSWRRLRRRRRPGHRGRSRHVHCAA
jgi:hypothetical protein